MTRLTWDNPKERPMKIGVDRGVLYIYNVGYVWDGLVTVIESPSNANENAEYYDGQKYIQQRTAEELSISISAFTYPDRLDDNDELLGLCYRTMLDKGYELHLVYNLSLDANEIAYSSMEPGIDPSNFKWDGTTLPVQVSGLKATSHIIVNSNYAPAETVSALEDILYGVDTVDARLPSIDEVYSVFNAHAIFRIIDNGDGTWTAVGPDSMIEMIDTTTYKITTPSIVYIDAESYKIRSW